MKNIEHPTSNAEHPSAEADTLKRELQTRTVACVRRRARGCDRKLRADSILNGLSREQKADVEGWLFEEGASYIDVQDRMKRQWSIVCSTSAVGRYFRYKMRCRRVAEFGEARETVAVVKRTKVKTEQMRSAAVKVLTKRLLERSMDNADVKELSGLGHLLSQVQMRDIQQKRLELENKKFEFNAAEAALEQLPFMEKLSEAEMTQEKARIEGIRHRLFGPLPKEQKQ